MTYVISFFRKILPARNMDKLEMFGSAEELWESKWGQDTFNKAFIPAFLGKIMSERSDKNYYLFLFSTPPSTPSQRI